MHRSSALYVICMLPTDLPALHKCTTFVRCFINLWWNKAHISTDSKFLVLLIYVNFDFIPLLLAFPI